MKRTALIGIAGLAMIAAPATAQTERQLEAHEHGHGTLNMAVEGKTLHIELEVPGFDIVGFEHEATSAEDRQAIETARKDLSQPAMLFVPSAEANCTVVSAKVELHEGGDGDDHDHGKKEDHDAGHDHDDDHAGEEHASDDHDHDKDHGHDEEHAGHTEFHAQYSFSCERIDAVTTVAFPYFERFPNAEELDVTLITDKGQTAFEVTRGDPSISIQGMM